MAIALPLINGCDSVKGTAAVAGIVGMQALQARPDRILTYDLEFQTSDNKKLVFNGTTECPHVSSLNGAGYRTNMPDTEVRLAGERWILSGINCHHEITGAGERRYVLFRVTNGKVAKKYFVAPGGSAQITKSSVASAWGSSKGEPVYLSKHSHGPYLYQKMMRASAPPLVAGLTDPIVLYEGTSTCGMENQRRMQLPRRAFFEAFERQSNVLAIEHGVLAYDETHSAWRTVAGIDPVAPLDAVTQEQFTAGCLTLILEGQKFIVSDSTHYSWLYVPKERAIYRFARLWDAPTKVWSNIGWEPCPRPSGVPTFSPGVAYLYENRGAGWPPRFAKSNADGTFSCKSGSWSYLGAPSWN